MKQEDKELLLKDICARLLYMPKIKITYQQQGIKGTDEGNVSCDSIKHIVNDLRNGVIIDMQIYLRPISSMTEEEKKQFSNFIGKTQTYKQEVCFDADSMINPIIGGYKFVYWGLFDKCIDWLLEHHFDYRGLIGKGLAIEVTKENNPYK